LVKASGCGWKCKRVDGTGFYYNDKKKQGLLRTGVGMEEYSMHLTKMVAEAEAKMGGYGPITWQQDGAKAHSGMGARGPVLHMDTGGR
jgi:hypothetical protein